MTARKIHPPSRKCRLGGCNFLADMSSEGGVLPRITRLSAGVNEEGRAHLGGRAAGHCLSPRFDPVYVRRLDLPRLRDGGRHQAIYLLHANAHRFSLPSPAPAGLDYASSSAVPSFTREASPPSVRRAKNIPVSLSTARSRDRETRLIFAGSTRGLADPPSPGLPPRRVRRIPPHSPCGQDGLHPCRRAPPFNLARAVSAHHRRLRPRHPCNSPSPPPPPPPPFCPLQHIHASATRRPRRRGTLQASRSAARVRPPRAARSTTRA